MTSNVRSGAPFRPLNPGNVISASVQLYRNNPGLYFPSAVFAYLWFLVPIYGWAKCAMRLALITRLAFQQLVDEPETADQARVKIKSSMWGFLLIGILVSLGIFGISLVGGLILGTAVSITFALNLIVGVIMGIILGVGFLYLLIWFSARWYVPAAILAIERRIGSAESVGRSWALTQKSVGRLQIVFLIHFVITVPISLLVSTLPDIALRVLLPNLATNPLIQLFLFLLGLVSGMALLVFGQIIKAVVYYDLRSRQEGLDLELRD